ncbi:MAG: hypothetical protein Q4D56_04260 [Bacteroides sp.]|nr:hypothetical protein [Bacteroides sp.]
MTDINDKEQRRLIIERYMNGDTTPEEERQLLMFYQDNDAQSFPDEEDVRRLVLATSSMSAVALENDGNGMPDANAMSSGDWIPDDDAVAEFDRILEAASVESERQISKRKLIRIAIASVASAAAVLAFLFLPSRQTADETPSTMSSSTEVTAMNIADIYELAETAFGNSESITVENTDGQTIVTVTNSDGSKASYVLTSYRDDSYTLVAIN